MNPKSQLPDPTEFPQLTDPMFPHLRFFLTRYESFSSWPRHLPHPALMADSGFYHVGIEDICVCFHCGISLKNWEVGETPSIEHNRHSPNCVVATASLHHKEDTQKCAC